MEVKVLGTQPRAGGCAGTGRSKSGVFTQLSFEERKNPDPLLLQRLLWGGSATLRASCGSLSFLWKESRCFADTVVHRLPVLPARDPSEAAAVWQPGLSHCGLTRGLLPCSCLTVPASPCLLPLLIRTGYQELPSLQGTAKRDGYYCIL